MALESKLMSRVTTPPVEVLYTVPNFVTAGSGLLLFNIATSLDRERFRPSVCVRKLANAPLEIRLREKGIEVFEGPIVEPGKPRWNLLQRCRSAARQVMENRESQKPIQIWHSFHYIDDYSEPLIARAAGAQFVFTKKNMSWNRRSWWLRSRLAHGIAAQNRDMIAQFFTGGFRRKVRYVPSGVDVDTYRPPTKERSKNDRFTVACVAHLLPVKDQVSLVEAAAHLPELRVILAGRTDDVAYATKVRQRIEQLALGERVEIAGQIDEIPSFLHTIDAFALPSLGRGRMEGCPVALLEAMSSGLPVIASDIPGSRDVVQHNQNGLLVSPEQPEMLADAIKTLIESPELCRNFGSRARERCVEQFSTALEAQRYMSLYDRVLSSRN